MTALAWMAPGCRAFMGRGILLSSRTLHNGRFLSAAVGSASFDYNDDPNDELENKLRQLTVLNGGKSLNPRSPRQVSNLLYGNNSFQPGAVTSNDWTGPTDKATLQKIILRDNTASSNDDNGDVNQKQVAKLVLQCRELLASTTNGNPKEKTAAKAKTARKSTLPQKASAGGKLVSIEACKQVRVPHQFIFIVHDNLTLFLSNTFHDYNHSPLN